MPEKNYMEYLCGAKGMTVDIARKKHKVSIDWTAVNKGPPADVLIGGLRSEPVGWCFDVSQTPLHL